jgi:predicted enzyme related to lactoylglutathione lyase
MQKVLGFGGFFFRAKDPAALAEWYEVNLGVLRVPSEAGQESWVQTGGETAFSPFAADTSYFGDPKNQFMLNFRVSDLAAMTAQLQAAGITVEFEGEYESMGSFARLQDPEGNPIQLWQPA